MKMQNNFASQLTTEKQDYEEEYGGDIYINLKN